jgi:riboflavin kinase/FMN adenylyltransferase
LYNVTPIQQGGVVTIGNFDGVHLGHQQLIAHVRREAKGRGVPSTVVTFEPHAFEFFGRDHLVIPRITRLREKFVGLAETGIDNVLILPFNQSLAALSASDFVTTVLVQSLRASHICVGDDFHFGHQRQGNFTLLQQMGQVQGFTVEAMPTLLLDGERVSSTRVRQSLLAGDLATAERLLGHSYTMHGRVRLGQQLGRTLGFPTANIYLHRRLTPLKGVYTVWVHGIADKPLPGVANIGTRPTVDGTRTLLEVHLLDFEQDIYGRYVKIEFRKKLRDEQRYPTLDLLKAQISQDVANARDYFLMRG